jgi:NAD(P)H dehydrogenase (quinone)
MPTMARVFVLLGHPNLDTYNGYLADRITTALDEAGHDVRRLNAGDLTFDPVLHQGYRAIQPLEPDLVTFQENLTWCEHWIVIYPLWWASTPAVLRGLIDRAIFPSYAFEPEVDGPAVTPLLGGRTGHLVTTMDAAASYIREAYRDADIAEMHVAVMAFCGITPGLALRLDEISFRSRDQLVRMADDAVGALLMAVN